MVGERLTRCGCCVAKLVCSLLAGVGCDCGGRFVVWGNRVNGGGVVFLVCFGEGEALRCNRGINGKNYFVYCLKTSKFV